MKNQSEDRRNKQENWRQKKEKKNIEVYPLKEWKEQHIKGMCLSPSKIMNQKTKKFI